jgi:membrane associated rhomboid family serine protease
MWSVLALCILVFVWQFAQPPIEGRKAVMAFGVIPKLLFGNADLSPDIRVIPAWASLITSMFLHGGFLHLGGNMLYLWIFGDNVEGSMGHGRFLVFYLLCGIAAGLSQAVMAPNSPVPLIGASGGIAGILGAYLMLHPRANVRVFVWLFIFFRRINVPAWLVLGGWLVLQFLSLGQPGEGGVAYVAHIGGFLAGMILVVVFKRREVALFDRPHSRAFEVTRVAGPWDRPQNGRRKRGPWG